MTTIEQQGPEVVAYMGIDWADQQHVICLQAADSDQQETFVIEQKPEAIQEWISQLRCRFQGGKVAVALEQSRGALLGVDFLVLYPINPQSVAKYRKVFSTSGAKDDPSDAALLLQLVRGYRDRFRPWVPDDPQTRSLQGLVQARRQLVDQRTALTNQLTSRLKNYFPQALNWAGGLDTLQACDFLKRWPSLEKLQRARPGVVRQFYLSHGCRRRQLLGQRLEAIGQAQPLTRDPAVQLVSKMIVQALIAQLRELIGALERFQREIDRLFQQHPDHRLFASLPGAGQVIAPRLLVAFGSDRQRFQAALEMEQLSGVAPVTQRSGRSYRVHRRWACPKFLRQTFHEFGACSIPWSPWARAFYQQQRARGKGHHAAVRALAYKWIRILFRCWQDRTPYDESRYQAALRRRQSPLVLALATAPAE